MTKRQYDVFCVAMISLMVIMGVVAAAIWAAK